ncbi:SCO0930 family lipoprotein [Amycolatopsis sp.]|uniref:SCO0930 family lipoprotein n=1 Tax=Amycolatopsis sp. TaxID=37632 RepID=UPI002B893710|nr:SCO0930 family lipoprotein [Amycolatopsis sp.]HVV10037.1 SCO0930 family lipoprotein [Amycolatopsis sp.]
MSARLIVSAAAVLSLGLLGACTSGAGSPATTPSQAPVAIQKQAATSPGTVKLTAAGVADLGQVLTDANGMTLYRFDKDTSRPPKSNCDGACATTWPPVIATGSVDVQGLDASLVGTVTRADGTQQVTVNGWPIYRYAKDTAAGQATGQGVGGTWAAVTPAGGKAAAPVIDTEINTTDIPGLDTVLTDQNGMTLYLFTKDSKKPSKSTCDGACATTWPPLLAVGEVKINGVDPKLVGKVTRSDGSAQVTVGGWPMYRYSKDTAPGQANGHAVGETWFEVEPAGCKVAAGKEPVTAGTGGY